MNRGGGHSTGGGIFGTFSGRGEDFSEEHQRACRPFRSSYGLFISNQGSLGCISSMLMDYINQ